MIDDSVVWISSGLLIVILYVFLSNTLWLLIGSRFIQCLPGVNIKGFKGTLKIATMLVLSVVGILLFLINFIFRKNNGHSIDYEISKMIKYGGSIAAKFNSSVEDENIVNSNNN